MPDQRSADRRADADRRPADEAFETRHGLGTTLTSHRHQLPYVALVLDGAYYEASADGLWRCEPGTLIVHPPLHAHANWFPESDVRVLNASGPCRRLAGLARRYGVWRTARSGAAADALANDPRRLSAALAQAEPVAPMSAPAAVAAAVGLLRTHPSTPIGAAARAGGVSREHFARLFRRHFGIPPRAFRAEHRLRIAVRLLADASIPLTIVAFQAGFADQAHLSRAVRSATGMAPRQLRRWLRSVAADHIRSSQ